MDLALRIPRALFIGALLLWPSRAQADDASTPAPVARRVRADLPARLADPDTADGRLDGDLGLVFGVGATFSGNDPRGVADLRLRYLDTAGVFFTYEDSFGAGPQTSVPARLFVAGLEMRPLFLARWVTGKDLGLTWPDLVIDSIGLELGAVFASIPPSNGLDSHPGLQASVGLELPLIARATGPWIGLRAGGRWNEVTLAGSNQAVAHDSVAFFSVTLAWHQIIATHLVDLHDEAPR